MQDERGALVGVEVLATLRAVKHPKCPSCGAANPQGLRRCTCGGGLEIATEVREETSIALNVVAPWYARALFHVASWLRALAKRIEGG